MTIISRFVWTFIGYLIAFIILLIPAMGLSALGFNGIARIILFANWVILGRYMTNKVYSIFHKMTPIDEIK